MNLDVIKQLVKIAKEEGVSELKVDSSNLKVEVKFGSTVSQSANFSQPVITTTAPQQQPTTSNATSKMSQPDTGLHVIKSPFVGTFYSAPGPGKSAYVAKGDRVKSGQPLCVLEAMKIMNEIEADINGEIVEICVENESLVEFGQPLFKIKPN